MAGESKLQSKMLKLLERRGAYAIKVISANKNGVHDIIGCHHGYFFSVEVKFGSNKPSPLQLAHQGLIRKSGGLSIIAWDIETVSDLLDHIELKTNPSSSINSSVSDLGSSC